MQPTRVFASDSLVLLEEVLLVGELLKFVLGSNESIDLLHEVVLALRYHSLDFVDFLVHNLVDLLHVIEHIVGLVVELVELLLVLLELDLTIVHLLAGVVFLHLRLHALQNLLLVVLAAIRVEIRVLMLAVVHCN